LLEEGFEPHCVQELWMMASPHANRAVDITATFASKLAALQHHVSQVAHEANLEGRLRGWASASAQAAGLGGGRLAELFQVVPMPLHGSS
ncbi:MAG: PIG-L family deacetylase, partial [Acidimicrobiales bacterium]